MSWLNKDVYMKYYNYNVKSKICHNIGLFYRGATILE